MGPESHPTPEPHQVLRQALAVRGVVQGVGFRPFVYRLASEEGLAGFIGNDTHGVTIEIEGPAEKIAAFHRRLRSETPPLARIDSLLSRDIPPKQEEKFRIVASDAHGQVSTGIPADAATCADCLRELLDPQDRRYRYPFLNCTNCGPRFTIARSIPYDRPQTSMARFKMCAACQAEYDDPLNRRFHAQPNACPVCGPRVWLQEAVNPTGQRDTALQGHGSMDGSASDARAAAPEAQSSLAPRFSVGKADSTLERRSPVGTAQDISLAGVDSRAIQAPNKHERALQPAEKLPIGQVLKGHDFSRAENAPKNAGALAPAEHSPVAETINRLLAGDILAIKGIGGFHLSVDATNEAAVMRLRERKRRYGKPLAVMMRDLDAARAVCVLTAEEETLLQTNARPIVLAARRKDSAIADAVAPGIPWLGVFLPYAPLQHLLFADSRVRALVMTSANLSEEPICIDNEEANQRLKNIADAFLLHDREILQRCDDSVMALVDGAPQLIRRARGFVPLAIPLPFDSPPLLAVGGHLKNVFALARGRFVYQSQHLGDLENLTGLNFFRESLAHLMHTFQIEPAAVVHDLHPGYLSTSLAKEWAAQRGLPLIAVQHHHAHIAACMAEHSLVGPVIGLSLDGTGYGTDGNIWGGEVLIARLDGPDPGNFDRFAHLQHVLMPGGEAAIHEPWRMAFAHLLAAGFSMEEATRLTGASDREARLLARMIDHRINTPLTSSLGRLFDAAAAVILQRRKVDYDAQAAIELEGIAVDEDDKLRHQEYVPELCAGDGPAVLNLGNLWQGLVEDLRQGLPKEKIAAEFHAGIAEGFIRAAANARKKTGINQVALSGGCLHNRRLARLLRFGLEAESFQVFQHRSVSPGDGGLSYGQSVVAAAILNRSKA